MRWYRERILPRVIDKVCGLKAAEPYRERVCQGLVGDVLEVGFGSGLNVPFYPSSVTQVTAVEPADLGWKLAADRVAASTIPIERAGVDGQRLPLDDTSCDSALITWSLCTIPDPIAALREVRRVLKPGAQLHFLEHGLAPDESVQRWQRRIEPLWKPLAGGCHLTRRSSELVREAGFELVSAEEFYEDGAPRFVGADTLGVAVAS